MNASFRPEAMLAWEDNAISRRMSGVIGGASFEAKALFQNSVNSWTRDLIAQIAGKAMDSTTAAAGDELVPTFEAAELWMDVNLATLVLSLMPQIQMPTNPYDWPAQLGDVDWFPAEENVASTTTDLSTKKSTLTAYGLKAGVPFSDELEEDAIIRYVPELRSQLVLNAAQIIDDVLLNADTTTADNINASGTTIAKTTRGKAHWLLGFDGLIHLPLVDNTTLRTDRNAALAASQFNGGLVKLKKYALGRNKGDVVFITDVNTALKAQALAQVETQEKVGLRATISSGELAQLYGRPLIASQQMLMANTAGAVNNSGTNNTTGRILSVNLTQWKVGFRRGITIEPDREPGKNQTTLYISFRIALAERTGTRSTATHTALEYDITGVAS